MSKRRISLIWTFDRIIPKEEFSRVKAEFENDFLMKNAFCKICKKMFSSVINYKSHVKRMHGENFEGVIKCDLCEGNFVDEKCLEKHRYTLHPEQYSPPDDFDKRSLNKSHSNLKRKFSDTLDSTIDENFERMTPSPKTPPPIGYFECQSLLDNSQPCLKAFDNVLAAMKHTIRAHGSLKFTTGFFHNDDLLPYFLRLTKEEYEISKKKYVQSIFCQYCEKQFDHRSIYSAHMKNMHENGEFKCSDCGAPFTKQVLV